MGSRPPTHGTRPRTRPRASSASIMARQPSCVIPASCTSPGRTKTRLLHFGNWKAPGGEPTWQGDSVAQWEMPRAGRGPGPPEKPKSGDLKAITTHMRAGYLRKNGVPYSANALLTEYYDVIQGVDGNPWLAVTSVVDDPRYLLVPFITSSNFKKLADGSGWDPTPCSARW